jgi:hypothetical protein
MMWVGGWERNDFNGLAAVYTGGLCSAPIYRLKKTTGIFTYTPTPKRTA